MRPGGETGPVSRQGWVAPHASSGMVYSQGKQMLIALGSQQRLLPAAVINQTVKERAAAALMTVPGVTAVGLGGRSRAGRPGR